jgi:LEA14-like dessication related protein
LEEGGAMASKQTSFFPAFLVVTSVVVLLFLAWFFYNEKSDENFHFKPEVFVTGIKVEDAGDKDLKIYATIRIINDLPVHILVRRLEYDVLLEGQGLVRSTFVKPFNIDKRDTSEITLPMEINKSQLTRLLKKYQGKDSAEYEMKGRFTLEHSVAGSHTVEVNRKMYMPVFQMITFQPTKFNIQKFSLAHPRGELKVKLDNPNQFTLRLRDIKLIMQMTDDLKMSGDVKEGVDLAPRSSNVIPFDLRVENMKVPQLLWKSLFKDEKTPYTSKLSFRIRSADERINNSVLVLSTKGTLKELKEGKQLLE